MTSRRSCCVSMEGLTPEVMDEKINASLRQSEFVLGVLGLRVVVLEHSMSRITSALFSVPMTWWRLYREACFVSSRGPSNRKLGTK